MCILASRDFTCIHPCVSKVKNKTEECRKCVENKEVSIHCWSWFKRTHLKGNILQQVCCLGTACLTFWTSLEEAVNYMFQTWCDYQTCHELVLTTCCIIDRTVLLQPCVVYLLTVWIILRACSKVLTACSQLVRTNLYKQCEDILHTCGL